MGGFDVSGGQKRPSKSDASFFRLAVPKCLSFLVQTKSYILTANITDVTGFLLFLYVDVSNCWGLQGPDHN